MDKIELLDTVELLADVPGTRYRNGMIGTVVECLSSDAFLVEFIDTDGDDLLVDCFDRRQLKLDRPQSDMTRTEKPAVQRVMAEKVPLA